MLASRKNKMMKSFLTFVLLLSGIITTAMRGTESQAKEGLKYFNLHVNLPDGDTVRPKIKKVTCINESGEEKIIPMMTTWKKKKHKQKDFKDIQEYYEIAKNLPLKDKDGKFLSYKIEYTHPSTNEEAWVTYTPEKIINHINDHGIIFHEMSYVMSYKTQNNPEEIIIDGETDVGSRDSPWKIKYSYPLDIIISLIDSSSWFVVVGWNITIPSPAQRCWDQIREWGYHMKGSYLGYDVLP